MYYACLYFGLMLFLGYVVYDTHIMLLRVSIGPDPDYILDALNLFIDFLGIFVRLLAILKDRD